jgi:hypothetical protein
MAYPYDDDDDDDFGLDSYMMDELELELADDGSEWDDDDSNNLNNDETEEDDDD